MKELARRWLRHCRHLPLLILTVVLWACSQETLLQPLNWSTTDTGVVRTADLAYGPEARQRLDIYAPAQAKGGPVILFWHGGSWQGGSKDYYRFVGSALAERGFVVAIPNYRLAPKYPFPAFVRDGALATQWMSNHAHEFGGNAARLFLSGHSAGGHIALILALDERYLREAGLALVDIAGIVSIAGPTGLENLRGKGLTGVFPAHVPDVDFSPIALARHAPRTTPPFLLISGLDDDVVYASSIARLADAIRAGGGQALVKAYPKAGHLGLLLGFSDLFDEENRIVGDMAAFADVGSIR